MIDYDKPYLYKPIKPILTDLMGDINNKQEFRKTNKPLEYKEDIYIKKNISPKNPTVPIRAEQLPLTCNISFSYLTEAQIDGLCASLQNRMERMLTPHDEAIKAFAMTPKYLDMINRQFEQDGIRSIYYTGVSANGMLNYLERKRLLHLNGKNTAFVLDEFSLEYLRNNPDKLKELTEKSQNRSIKFYCLETNKNESDSLIEEFKNLTGEKFEVTRIKRPENSDFSKHISAEKIKEMMQMYARDVFPNDTQMQNKLIGAALKYMNGNFVIFSYATLCEQLKALYKMLEKQVTKIPGATMDDVVYLIPKRNKSYDIINYLYAKTNNVPQKQFMELKYSEQGYSNNKIYVILDDFCGTGASAVNNLDIASKYLGDNFLTLSYIIACNEGRNEICNSKNRMPVNFVSCISYDDLKSAKGEDKFLHSKYPVRYSEDEEFLKISLKSGFANMYSFVNFPYMLPDNSCDLNQIMGGYFLEQ